MTEIMIIMPSCKFLKIVQVQPLFLTNCRSLDFRELSKCPQRPGMGACRYSSNREVSGEALGYVTGNIVEEEGGALRLMYSSGERCASGRARMVHVEFQCGQSAGAVSSVMHNFMHLFRNLW